MSVLSTRVEPEFAARVELYCKENGISPSSLLKSLLQEELDGKEPITTYYQQINKQFKALSILSCMILHENIVTEQTVVGLAQAMLAQRPSSDAKNVAAETLQRAQEKLEEDLAESQSLFDFFKKLAEEGSPK